MRFETVKQYKPKSKIKIILANGFRYVGEVVEVSNEELVMIDKWKSRVTINLDDISLIQEVVEERSNK